MNKDFASIQQLHAASSGVGMSGRGDASNPRGPEVLWKKAPTIIAIPSNRPVPSSSSTNPYSRSRLQSNLAPRKAGNVTAGQTIFSQKSKLGQKSYRPKNPDAFTGPSTRPEVVEVSDDDIGVAMPRASHASRDSPDPIDSISEDEPTAQLSSRFFSASEPQALQFTPYQPRARNPPRDGNATRRLTAKVQRNDPVKLNSPDIIVLDEGDESPTAEPPPPSDLPEPEPVPDPEDDVVEVSDPVDNAEWPPPLRERSNSTSIRHTSPTLTRLQGKGKVTEQVKRLNGQAQHADPPTNKGKAAEHTKRLDGQAQHASTAEEDRQASESAPLRRLAPAPVASSSKVPHIDLRALPPSVGVKGRMKGKDGATSTDYASQPSGFHSGKQAQKAKAGPAVNIALPVEKWALGKKVFDDPDELHWFIFDGKTIHVKSRPQDKESIISLQLSGHVKSVQCTGHPPNVNYPVVLKLRTGNAPTKDKNLIASGAFKHGAHGRAGTIVFVFQTRHANWEHGEPYKTILHHVRKACKHVDHLDGHASQTCWAVSAEQVSGDDDEVPPPAKKRNTAATAVDMFSLPRPSPKASTSRSMSEDASNDSLDLPKIVPRRSTIRSSSNGEPATAIRRSTRRAANDSARNSPALDPDELLLVYPPTGAGAINVTRGDLKRLDPGQYLNDTLIEFGLKLWLNDFRERDPELAEQVHVFSSFFYKKISVKNKQEGYQSVRKWTSKFDLFKKKYIIVPINEHLHWYLAIIINPDQVLQPPPPLPPKALLSMQTRKRKRESGDSATIEDSNDPLAVGPSDTRPSSPRSASEADETSVEALLDGCAISQPKEPSRQASPAAEAKDDKESSPSLSLMYPTSEPDVDPAAASEQAMDVDAPPRTSEPPAANARSASSEPIEVDSPPTKVAEVLEIDGSPMEVDAGVMSATSAIPANQFYSSASAKGKARALSPEVPHPDTPIEEDTEKEEAAEAEAAEGDDPNKCWIFTFDSLGSKHPAAINNLKLYLQYEAKDKKGLDPANTTPATGRPALVPAQPNFCDCGVYLIHFVQAFMKNPRRATEIILSKKPKDYTSREREQDWDAEAVASFREELRARADSLADLWRTEKAAREAARKEEEARKKAEAEAAGPSAATSEAAEESDDEIIVGEIITKPKKTGGGASKGKGKAKAVPEEMKADRLR